jgi:hypothetical protein
LIHVFLDESGDLGWTFDRPYRQGGSSRYLTLAFLIADQSQCKHPKRVAKKLAKERGIPHGHELKGCELPNSALVRFAQLAARMLTDHPELTICTITVNKENVQAHIRADANKLYNYMLNLSLPDHIKAHPEVVLSPDPRSIKVASGNSMVDYLQTQLWFEHNSSTHLVHQPLESRRSLAIQFVDVVSHIAWSCHEDGELDAYRVLAPHMKCKHLFFGPGGQT